MPVADAEATITIDVTKDLASSSALKSMLSSQKGAIFSIVGELAKYASEPVKQAAAGKAAAKVALSGAATWKTTNGIGFSLTPTASCSIAIDTVSETFAVAMNIDSPSTTNVGVGPLPGKVFVNIDLDFSIQGSVSGGGAVGALGIAGKASGSKSATLTFCQPVDDSMLTLDAVTMAFSQVAFPLDPTCALDMQNDAIAKVSFDGALACEVDVTYGLGDHKVSAPSLAKVQQSLQGVVQITPPSLDIHAGAKGSLSYNHTDHFAIIVHRTSSAAALLYLVRSSENDWAGSLGISVGVTSSNATVTVDQAALQSAVGKITGSSALAGQVVSAASQPLNNLQTSLNGKLKSLVSDITGQAGLTVSLGQQKGHTALFTFSVNLQQADLAEKSWSALVGGSVQDALVIRGFALVPGSGVSDSIKRSSTIQFQFFNLFAFKSVSDYFSNAYTELGPDGTIRVFRDVGQEQQASTKRALTQFRIHFVATATQAALNNIAQANVDLYIELSESGSAQQGTVLAHTVGLIPPNATINAAQSAMASYVANNPKGTLTIINIVKRSAYAKLACTPYNGKKPLPLPHQQDQSNWTAFQNATEALEPDLGFVPRLSFLWWMDFNRACIDQVGSTVVPDRRQAGNPNAVPPSFYAPLGAPGPLVAYFFLASAGFMNLIDDLTVLAASTPGVDDTQQWNDLLNFLTSIVTKDVFIPYAKPTAAGLLAQCAAGGASANAIVSVSEDKSSLSCTVTVM